MTLFQVKESKSIVDEEIKIDVFVPVKLKESFLNLSAFKPTETQKLIVF